MTKHTTITAEDTRFPLSRLVLSPLNPRQHVPAEEVQELAESLWTAGLIQNLAGIEDEAGMIEIVAGGRRLRALQLLAERHADLAETHPKLASPLVQIAPDRTTAQAWAVAENSARRDLPPADEIRAYGKMARNGATPAIIARAFAVTEKSVYRRLALANLPEPVIEALAANEINLSMAACFTICEDETLALEVLDRCRGEAWSDYNLKNALRPQSIKSSDRRALFVGLDAYKDAGGVVAGDLFAEESYLNDHEVLDRLFSEKLEAAAKEAGEGWKWVEAEASETSFSWWDIEQRKMETLRPVRGTLTEEQSARFDEIAELSEPLDDETQAELDALEAILTGGYTPEQKAHAGCVVYVDRQGALSVTAGLVRSEDKADARAAGLIYSPTRGDDKPKSPISDKLRDDLRRVSRGARQHAALRDPDLLIDLLAYQLSHDLRWDKPFGIMTEDVPNWPTTEAEGYSLDDRLTTNPPRDMFNKDLGKSFRAFRQKGPDHVRGELIRFLAAQLRGGSEQLAALIEKATQPNTREVWTPTAANFFGRVGGPYLSNLWRELLDLSEDHPSATSFDKLKKSEKAAKLEALFGDDDTTRTAHGVSEAQAEKIAAWLPEGME